MRDVASGSQVAQNAVENNNQAAALRVLGVPAIAAIYCAVDKSCASATDAFKDILSEQMSESQQQRDKLFSDTFKGNNDNATTSTEGGTSTATPPPPDDNEDKNNYKDYKNQLTKEDRIDLSKFNKRVRIDGKRAEFVDPKTGWRISPDRGGNNSHGGSGWKLINNKGQRVGTLTKDGKFLRFP